MSEIDLDDYLRAYRAETNREPPRRLMDRILATPDLALSEFVGDQAEPSVWGNPWRWFDMALPRAVGWALTCFLGVYLGLTSAEQGVSPGEETYYMYEQAQFILYEDIMAGNSGDEGADQ